MLVNIGEISSATMTRSLVGTMYVVRSRGLVRLETFKKLDDAWGRKLMNSIDGML